jgi:DNA-binding response OmpR family regulator
MKNPASAEVKHEAGAAAPAHWDVVVMPEQLSTAQGRTSIPGAVKVLLVEDDVELREALAENLRLNGMDVLEADTAAAFREVVRMERVDAAIIDINLPDASGFDLAHELSGDDDRPGIVMLTARTERHDRLRGYAEGADVYMTKPVDNDELVLVVRNLSSRIVGARDSKPHPSEPEWLLDVARRLLTSPDGRIVVLSGKEVMLFELFAKADGAFLSRSYIASAMGYGAPGPARRGLDAALHRLREKTARIQIELPILVVHSKGVRFVAPLKKVR